MEIALISTELFLENSPIKDNTIIEKFVPYIILVQKMYIERILGRALVQELQTQIKAASVETPPDPYPITPVNQALLLELAPALSFYAVYQGLPFHWAAIVNKGITLRNSENSDAVALGDIAQLRRWVKDDAEEWARKLQAYLCKCASSYPLWAPAQGYGCAENNCGEPDKQAVIYDFDGFHVPSKYRR